MFGWPGIGGLLAWSCRSPLQLGLTMLNALGLLLALSFILLLQGGWVPLAPSVLGVVVTEQWRADVHYS